MDIVERLRSVDMYGDMQEAMNEAAANIVLLRAIIKKQMSPTEISQQLAECNELADAYAEQNVTVKELRAKLAVERERCAKMCDDMAERHVVTEVFKRDALREAAAAIRKGG